MHTCKTCKHGHIKQHGYKTTVTCHLDVLAVEKLPEDFCSHHTANQRERDRLEIAKAAMGGLLANTEFRGGYHVHVEAAMMYADALLSALEEQ